MCVCIAYSFFFFVVAIVVVAFSFSYLFDVLPFCFGRTVGRSVGRSVDRSIYFSKAFSLIVHKFVCLYNVPQTVRLHLYSLPNWLKPNSDYFGGWIYWLDTGHIVAFFSPDKLLSAMYCTFHISFYISFWLCVFCAVSSFLPYRIIHHNTHGLPCFFFWVPLVGISSTAFCACCFFLTCSFVPL